MSLHATAVRSTEIAELEVSTTAERVDMEAESSRRSTTASTMFKAKD